MGLDAQESQDGTVVPKDKAENGETPGYSEEQRDDGDTGGMEEDDDNQEDEEEEDDESDVAIGACVGRTYMRSRVVANGESVEHPAVVLQRRVGPDGAAQCYVHYTNLDRRLDEWVPEASLGEEVDVPKTRDRRRRGERRSASKIDDGTSGAFMEGTGQSSRKRAKSEHAHFHEITKVRNVERVQLGKHEIDCWYYSPYPGKFGSASKLYICERTFKYFDNPKSYERFLATATQGAKPPGREIYHDTERSICVFEFDGAEQVLFGQNLCLFGKLFIEHKTLSYDPTPFFFYVLYEVDRDGYHPVGYFSKEKESKEQYNLACIVSLPPYQRKGYGKFIISLSYEVTKRRGEIGSPEKPLSDLGKLSYRSYWSFVLLDYFDALSDAELGELTLDKLAYALGVKPEDVLSTLQHLKMIYQLKGQLAIKVNRDEVRAQLEPYRQRRFSAAFCKPELLSL